MLEFYSGGQSQELETWLEADRKRSMPLLSRSIKTTQSHKMEHLEFSTGILQPSMHSC